MWWGGGGGGGAPPPRPTGLSLFASTVDKRWATINASGLLRHAAPISSDCAEHPGVPVLL